MVKTLNFPLRCPDVYLEARCLGDRDRRRLDPEKASHFSSDIIWSCLEKVRYALLNTERKRKAEKEIICYQLIYMYILLKYERVLDILCDYLGNNWINIMEKIIHDFFFAFLNL